jgi:hypothetical protein
MSLKQVQEFLSVAMVSRAKILFDSMPEETTEEYAKVREQLANYEEAMVLGESVYPSKTVHSTRWVKAQAVPEASRTGAARRAWYPGRVRRLFTRDSERWVELVFAVPAVRLADVRVKISEIKCSSFLMASGSQPAVNQYIEIGSYGDNSIIICITDGAAL